MQKISFVFQALFKFLLIFLIVFVWVRYFVRSLVLCLVITIAVSAAIFVVTSLFSKKRKSSASLKASEREDAENMFLSLSLENKPLDFFLKLASKKHLATKKDDCILICHSGEEKVILQPFLFHRELGCDDIAKFGKGAKI